MKQGGPRPITARATVAAAFLATVALLDVVRVWAISTEASILRAVRDGAPFSLSEARASDERLTALAGLYVGLLLGAGIAWCVWQHRAHANLRALRRSGLRFTAGWAVGWWFVPIASLWKPFEAVRELWQASDPGSDALSWRSVRTWPAIGWWWACWIGSGVVTAVGTAQRGTELDPTIRGDMIVMVGLALQVVAAVLAIAIVRQVVTRQTALEATGAGSTGPPPMPPPALPMPPMPAPLD